MRTDRDRYIQIACRAAVCAGIALTALLNGLAVVDAGRDVDLELARLTNAALTAALRTRLLDDLAGAAAVRAGALRLEHAERRALGLGHDAGAAAVRAGLRRRALGCAGAAAVATGLDALDRDLLFAAEGRLLEGQDNGLADGLAALRCVAALRTAAAEAAAEAACACTAAVARVDACKAELVILCALVLVGQHLIRLVDLLELVGRLGIILVEVGVVLARELAVRLFQLVLARALLHAEHLVIVSFVCHKNITCTRGQAHRSAPLPSAFSSEERSPRC